MGPGHQECSTARGKDPGSWPQICPWLYELGQAPTLFGPGFPQLLLLICAQGKLGSGTQTDI